MCAFSTRMTFVAHRAVGARRGREGDDVPDRFRRLVQRRAAPLPAAGRAPDPGGRHQPVVRVAHHFVCFELIELIESFQVRVVHQRLVAAAPRAQRVSDPLCGPEEGPRGVHPQDRGLPGRRADCRAVRGPPPLCLRRVPRLAPLTWSLNRWPKILEHTSFAWMKAHEDKFEGISAGVFNHNGRTSRKRRPHSGARLRPYPGFPGKPVELLKHGAMVRKGQVGAAKDDGITPEISATSALRCVAFCARTTERQNERTTAQRVCPPCSRLTRARRSSRVDGEAGAGQGRAAIHVRGRREEVIRVAKARFF